MQPSTHPDLYRSRTPDQSDEKGAFDVLHVARQREIRIGAAKAALDQIYASTETINDQIRSDAHDVSAESNEINMPEVLPEIYGIGISLQQERDEVIKNGWPV